MNISKVIHNESSVWFPFLPCLFGQSCFVSSFLRVYQTLSFVSFASSLFSFVLCGFIFYFYLCLSLLQKLSCLSLSLVSSCLLTIFALVCLFLLSCVVGCMFDASCGFSCVFVCLFVSLFHLGPQAHLILRLDLRPLLALCQALGPSSFYLGSQAHLVQHLMCLHALLCLCASYVVVFILL